MLLLFEIAFLLIILIMDGNERHKHDVPPKYRIVTEADGLYKKIE